MEIRPILVIRLPNVTDRDDIRTITENVFKVCHGEYITLVTTSTQDDITFELLSVNKAKPADLEMIKKLTESTERLLGLHLLKKNPV